MISSTTLKEILGNDKVAATVAIDNNFSSDAFRITIDRLRLQLHCRDWCERRMIVKTTNKEMVDSKIKQLKNR